MYLTFCNKIVSGTVDMLSGEMPIDYMLFIGALLVVGVVFVEMKLDQLVKKFNRQSLISFVFTFIMLVSIALIVITMVDTIKTNKAKNLPMFGFNSIC